MTRASSPSRAVHVPGGQVVVVAEPSRRTRRRRSPPVKPPRGLGLGIAWGTSSTQPRGAHARVSAISALVYDVPRLKVGLGGRHVRRRSRPWFPSRMDPSAASRSERERRRARVARASWARASVSTSPAGGPLVGVVRDERRRGPRARREASSTTTRGGGGGPRPGSGGPRLRAPRRRNRATRPRDDAPSFARRLLESPPTRCSSGTMPPTQHRPPTLLATVRPSVNARRQLAPEPRLELVKLWDEFGHEPRPSSLDGG